MPKATILHAVVNDVVMWANKHHDVMITEVDTVDIRWRDDQHLRAESPSSLEITSTMQATQLKVAHGDTINLHLIKELGRAWQVSSLATTKVSARSQRALDRQALFARFLAQQV